MADMSIIVRVDWLFSEEEFSGMPCSACNDCIYGSGFRMVMLTRTDRKLIPDFKETNVVLCKSCNDKME